MSLCQQLQINKVVKGKTVSVVELQPQLRLLPDRDVLIQQSINLVAVAENYFKMAFL